MKKIESFELTTAQRKELEQVRSDLLAAFAGREKVQKRYDEVSAKLDSVKESIENLIVLSDGMDDAACAKLTMRRQQVPLLERELKKADAAIVPTELPIKMATREAASRLASLLRPIVDALADEATELLTPYYKSHDRSRRIANDSDLIHSARSTLTRLALHVEASDARRILANVESTLNNDLGWFWPND